MGQINSVFTGSAVDGPGIRTVVFFQGCPLRCAYCHNPETQAAGGKTADAEKIFEQISKYSNYYGKKGGVTFSGGEVLMQPDFLVTLLKLCKAGGIHTCIDTSGCTGANTPDAVFELCDLVILDIKMNTEDDYNKYIKGSLSKTLEFLEKCEQAKTPVWIRQVIVPGINDTKEQVEMLKNLVCDKTCVEKIQLLPFERLCEKKYKDMGIAFPMGNTPAMDKDKLKELQALLQKGYQQ